MDRAARSKLARALVLSLIGLSYLAALETWPRFLDGFADNVCLDRFCSDALFRSYAIPVATVAFFASAFASWLAVDGHDFPPTLLCAIGGLAAVYAMFLVSPTTRSWHFIVAGLAVSLAAVAIWRSSDGTRSSTILVGLASPWPFLAFALGYPAPR
jgi:apolipoprotein N-acyltransferase